MKIVPLAAESLGVRSMATYVEVGQTRVLIDPGATLAPARFNLPPSDEEWEALRRANDRISAYAARADLVFVSHYHEDHFRSDPATYAGRAVLVKDPRRMIAGLQARRAAELWAALGPVARVQSADGSRRRTLDLELSVSPPLPHGADGTRLGYVLVLTLTDPAERDLVERGIENLLRVLDATGCRVIMDHHALRDTRFAERFARLWETGAVVTAAGDLGLADAPLESRRHRAWAAVRKPPASAGRAGERAIMTRAPRRFAKGGSNT